MVDVHLAAVVEDIVAITEEERTIARTDVDDAHVRAFAVDATAGHLEAIDEAVA